MKAKTGVHSFVADPVTLRCSNVSTRCYAPSKSVDTKRPSTREKTCQFPPSVHAWTANMAGWKQQSGHVFPLIHQQKSPQSSAKAPDVREKEKGHKGGWHLATLGGRHSRHPFGRCAPSPSAALRAPYCVRWRSLAPPTLRVVGCPWSHRFASGTSYPPSCRPSDRDSREDVPGVPEKSRANAPRPLAKSAVEVAVGRRSAASDPGAVPESFTALQPHPR